MPKLPKAILFDLDETLIEYPSKLDSWRIIFEEFAQETPGLDLDDVVSFLDVYTDWYWGDPERHRIGRHDMTMARGEIATAALRQFGIDDVELGTRIGHALNLRRDKHSKLFPDALETLKELGQRDVKLALVTNGHSAAQRPKIERFEIARYFGCILIESEFGHGKPDKRVFQHVLTTLDVDAADAWMVGDKLDWEVAGPQQVGISGIWYDPYNAGIPIGCEIRPDRVIHRLSELLDG